MLLVIIHVVDFYIKSQLSLGLSADLRIEGWDKYLVLVFCLEAIPVFGMSLVVFNCHQCVTVSVCTLSLVGECRGVGYFNAIVGCHGVAEGLDGR